MAIRGELLSAMSPPVRFCKLFTGISWGVLYGRRTAVTNKYARGFNGITVFVLLTAVALWFPLFSYAATCHRVFTQPTGDLLNFLPRH